MGSRASETETDAKAQQPFDPSELPIPGADESDSVAPCVVISTPEAGAAAREFFVEAKAAESVEQKKRARMRSRVFTVMQYHGHPKTGEVIFTQEQLDEGLAALGDGHPKTGEVIYTQEQLDEGLAAHGDCLYRWAYIWHDSDRLVEVDEGTTEMTCCGLKGLHMHLVLWVKGAHDSRPTVRTVSDAFSVPSPRVRVPNEVAAQGGIADHKGRNAAERAFFDLCEYLTHETRTSSGLVGVHHPDRHYLVDKSQPGNPGKYQYGRGRVVSNFDFGAALDGHMATRHNVAEGGGGAKLSKLFQAVGQGSLTLKQVRDQGPAIYFAKGNLAHFQKLRGDFLAHQDAPGAVMNFYLFGEGGTGKDLLGKALARSLAPEAERPYFKVGGDN
ncbi:RNA helicase, partial [Arthrobacter deserti]|nr:RNA helicase [Arthrobacter deserti]